MFWLEDERDGMLVERCRMVEIDWVEGMEEGML